MNLIGKRFGKLVVKKCIGENDDGQSIWLCYCDCGKKKAFLSNELQQAKSCGCLNDEDLKGQRFGKLVARHIVGNEKDHAQMWLCDCDCGKTKKVLADSLRLGFTKSCGCGG
jgi:hypothetical protein